MPVTIKDIAREVGVSVSTVSRVLNGKSTQNAELVTLVKAKAKELNYQVNTAAAGLRTNRTKLIGIVVPQISNDFFSEILSGVEEAAEAEGYNLLICQSNESSTKELKLIKSLVACNVEGILISTCIENIKSQEAAETAIMAGKKVVYFDRVPDESIAPYVTVQDYEGAYKITKHLIEQGRKSFLYHGLHKDLTNDKARSKGVKDAVNDSGIDKLEFLYTQNQDDLLARLKSMEFEALVCYNDDIAARDISSMQRAGINIPRQIAVTGFDNRSMCELIFPTLTTVNHSTAILGKKAVEILLAMLDSDDPVENIVIPAEIIVRESSAS
ncbi:MAG: LacI family DNA-binding transcriptional regulator [Cyclobacteriaceae bacterium]